MLRRKDGTFYKREVRRAVPDVVKFVVYLGLGGYTHAATLDRLWDHMKYKVKFSRISKEDFKNLIRRCDGWQHGLWSIEVSDNDVVTLV